MFYTAHIKQSHLFIIVFFIETRARNVDCCVPTLVYTIVNDIKKQPIERPQRIGENLLNAQHMCVEQHISKHKNWECK